MEVVCKYVQFGRFINRGFLRGPYCPIYGVGSVLILFNRLSGGAMHALCIGLAVLMLVDSVISVMVRGKIRKSVNHTAADDTEALTKAVREKLSAFPCLKLYNSKLLQQMKLKREAVEKAEKIRSELDEYETRMRDFYRGKRMKE